MALVTAAPWWLKMGAKIVLARLPVSYSRWRALGAFRHGAMLDVDYAIHVFERHFQQIAGTLPRGATILELGPGDSLATAVIAAAHGVGRTWLVDAGAFASAEVAPYNALARRLTELGHTVPGAPYARVDEMLRCTGAAYFTSGLASLAAVPDRSLQFSFSQAVLEHVALTEFDATIASLFRLHEPGSATSHRVDLQDHLAHSLNSLRFSRRTWESRLLSASGFYTNRLRAPQVLSAFERAGFTIEAQRLDRWPALPISRRRLHPEFAALTDDELCVRGVDLFARRPIT